MPRSGWNPERENFMRREAQARPSFPPKGLAQNDILIAEALFNYLLQSFI
jgi:hypothetical protein